MSAAKNAGAANRPFYPPHTGGMQPGSRTLSCRSVDHSRAHTLHSAVSVERYLAAASAASTSSESSEAAEPPPAVNGSRSMTQQPLNAGAGKPKRLRQFGTDRMNWFVDNTTFHGFNDMWNNTGVPSCVFWTTIMMIVFTIAFIQMKNLTAYFMNNPTLTSIGIIYPENGLKFPEFTVCLLSKINNTKLKENYPDLSNDRKTAEFSTTSFFSAYSTALMNTRYFSAQTESDPKVIDQDWQNLQKSLEGMVTDNVTSFLDKITFDCPEILKSCWIANGGVFPCCQDKQDELRSKNPEVPIFAVSAAKYLVHSGACYDLKPRDIIRQELPGPVGGFGFVFVYPTNELFPTAYNAYDEHAVHLFMSPIDAALEKNPIALPVGYHAHVSLKATQTQRQTQDELGRTMCSHPKLKYFTEYSYPACQIECLIDMLKEKCQCTGVFTFANIPQINVCTPLEAMRCYDKLQERFTEMLVNCRKKNCQEACYYWTYTPSVTIGKVFNPKISEELRNYWRLNDTDGKPDENLIIADVYFDEIQYTQITQKSALTIEGFISSIGGSLGLWTGASILTWIQLFYWCCSFVFDVDSPLRQYSRRLIKRTRRRRSRANRKTLYDVKLGSDEPMSDNHDYYLTSQELSEDGSAAVTPLQTSIVPAAHSNYDDEVRF